jgi:hypothetical protein
MDNVIQLHTVYAVMALDTAGQEWAVCVRDTKAEAMAVVNEKNANAKNGSVYYCGVTRYTIDPSMPSLEESEELQPEYEISEADMGMSAADWSEFVSDTDYPDVPA